MNRLSMNRLLVVGALAACLVAFAYPEAPKSHATTPKLDDSPIARQFSALPTPKAECRCLAGEECRCATCLCGDKVTVSPLRESDLVLINQVSQPIPSRKGDQADYVPIEIQAPNVEVKRITSEDGKLLKLVVVSTRADNPAPQPAPQPQAVQTNNGPPTQQVCAPGTACANGYGYYNNGYYYPYQNVNYSYGNSGRGGPLRILRPRNWFSGRRGGGFRGGCSSCG